MKSAILLVGSPKPRSSTSKVFGEYFLQQLKGVKTETILLHKIEEQDLVDIIKNTDLIILTMPLYVDSLPWSATRALEVMSRMDLSKKSFLLLINCGFPEEGHNQVAIRICKNFAARTGCKWLGALSVGGGGSFGGGSIEALGGRIRNQLKGMNMAANDILKGKKISKQAKALFSKPVIPNLLYVKLGHMGWKSAGKKNKAGDLYKKPYDEPKK